MANSDPIKQEIFGSGGLHTLQGVLGENAGHAGCMEAGLGLLAAVALRNPEASAAAISDGMPGVVLQVRSPYRGISPPLL